MGNEELMVVVSAITEVSSTLGSVISTYKGTRMVNRMKLKLVDDKIRACIAMQRASAIAELGRVNLSEYKKTLDMLNGMDLEGPMGAYAMRTIESMAEGLDHILEDLKNEYRHAL